MNPCLFVGGWFLLSIFIGAALGHLADPKIDKTVE
tara:strand:+ start:1587 stop:1691 length:105 start_codon:yes stop_codon:yes gene_type:complete